MPLRRRKRKSPPVAAAIAGLVAVTAVVVARIRGGGLVRRGVRGPKGAPTAAHVTWTCDGCGTKYRSAGLGRHQVHWLADAPEDQPVLGDSCVSCGRPLPITAE